MQEGLAATLALFGFGWLSVLGRATPIFPSRRRSNEARDSFEGLGVGASGASFPVRL